MIHSRIKEIMEAKGFTYQKLEKATGLTNVTITRVRGRYISQAKLETLETIARALGVSVKDLFEEEP